jgi:hypothetical protein
MKYLPVPPAEPPNGPKLRDIHLPPSPAWWPPAPGWWVLAGLILIALAVAVWMWRRRRSVVARRHRILREVDRLTEQHRLDSDHGALAAGLHQLLRRVARQHDSRAARQTGAAWRQTLARVSIQAPVLDRLFALDELIYQVQPSFDPALVVNDVRAWLRLALKPSAWKAPTMEHADA